MAAQARFFLATSFRNQIAIEYPQATGVVLDTIATTASLASSLALSTGRNVQVLNMGPRFVELAVMKDPEIRKVLKGKPMDALRDTGQFVSAKRKAKRSLAVTCALVEVLDTAEEAGIKSAFMVEAMDDGQVRVRWDGSVGEFMEPTYDDSTGV
jgi:hypothetical protein